MRRREAALANRSSPDDRSGAVAAAWSAAGHPEDAPSQRIDRTLLDALQDHGALAVVLITRDEALGPEVVKLAQARLR